MVYRLPINDAFSKRIRYHSDDSGHQKNDFPLWICSLSGKFSQLYLTLIVIVTVLTADAL
jgi:hypothetical protein